MHELQVWILGVQPRSALLKVPITRAGPLAMLLLLLLLLLLQQLLLLLLLLLRYYSFHYFYYFGTHVGHLEPLLAQAHVAQVVAARGERAKVLHHCVELERLEWLGRRWQCAATRRLGGLGDLGDVLDWRAGREGREVERHRKRHRRRTLTDRRAARRAIAPPLQVQRERERRLGEGGPPESWLLRESRADTAPRVLCRVLRGGEARVLRRVHAMRGDWRGGACTHATLEGILAAQQLGRGEGLLSVW